MNNIDKIKLFNFCGIFHGAYGGKLFYFRFFGYGLHIRNTQTHTLTFSERNGYKKPLFKIGVWWVRTLKKNKP